MIQADIKEYSRDFCICVQERSGAEGSSFFRRGLPFAKGILKDEKQFYLQGSDGKEPSLQTKVLETYSDGSIKWLSVAFSVWLKPYETYCLSGKFKTRAAGGEALAKETKGGVMLDNARVKATVAGGGIKTLTLNGKEMLGKKGICLSVRDESGKHVFKAETVKIYINGDVYATVRLTGKFTDTHIHADWFITLYKASDTLYHEVKFNSRGANVLYSQAIEAEFCKSMNQYAYADRADTAGGLVFSDWFSASAEEGQSVLMVSKDVQRFHKTTAPVGVHNGYAVENTSIVFSPIQYDLGFEWPDGVTRTVHLSMLFGEKQPAVQEIEQAVKRTFAPPLLTIPSKWFVYNGATDDDSQSEAISRMSRMLSDLYGFYWHHFEAGKLPNTLKFDHVSEQVTCSEKMHRSHGAVSYNLWRTYMNFAEPKMYDLNMEYAEHWTDTIQYRGEISALWGANRYHTGDFFNDHECFCTSMPYYGDLSGLYMTYCMTGDPYYEEAFREGIDFLTEDVEKNGVPVLSYWTKSMFAVHKSPEFQTRCCIITRCLYYAYQHYGDEHYREAAKSIIRWLSEAQNPNGSFYEDYYYDTKEPMCPLINGKRQPLEKQYIMLWGARGVVDYCRDSGDRQAIKVIEILADYLIDSMDELGFLWYPNNRDEAAVDRDVQNQKSSCLATTASGLYAIGVLCDITRNPVYLRAVLKMARYCISTWGTDGSGGQLQGSATPYLQGLQTASKLIKENMDFVIEEGFADVAAILDTNTRETFCEYPKFDNRYRRFVVNTFDTVWGKAVYFLHRQTAFHGGGRHREHAFDFDFELSRDRRLWFGNYIYVGMDSESVRLKKPIRVVDLIHLLKTDITVSDLTGEAEVAITKYTQDEIVIRLHKGSGFTATVTDGFFHVTDGALYTARQNERICTLTPKNGVLQFELLPGTNTELTLSKNHA